MNDGCCRYQIWSTEYVLKHIQKNIQSSVQYELCSQIPILKTSKRTAKRTKQVCEAQGTMHLQENVVVGVRNEACKMYNCLA